MRNGFLSINRSLIEWEWYGEPITSRLFLHLLLVANWETGYWKGVEIARGQCLRTRKKLAEETGLSEQNVRTAIKHLISTGDLTTERTQYGMLLTIEKYEAFTSSISRFNQKTNHELTSNQPDIKKNKKNNKEIEAFFERLWKEYPNKRGKSQVSKRQKETLYQIGYDALKRAMDRYRKELEKEIWRKPQNGSTFFNSGYVDYLDENYCEEKSLTASRQEFEVFDRKEMEQWKMN